MSVRKNLAARNHMLYRSDYIEENDFYFSRNLDAKSHSEW